MVPILFKFMLHHLFETNRRLVPDHHSPYLLDLVGFCMSVRLALDVRCDFALWWEGRSTNSRAGHFYSTEPGYKSTWKLYNAIFPTIIVNAGLNCAPDHSILFLIKNYIWESGYHGCSWSCLIVTLSH